MDKLPDLDFVGWKKFHQLSFELALAIENQEDKIDTIVSISRGGLVISRILSDVLDLPIYNVSISSYKGINQRKELVMQQKLGKYLEKQSVLLVDEIVDTGDSLARAVSYVNRVRIDKLITAALHVKPHAKLRPDYSVAETSKWVVYPYEVRETIEALWGFWEKANWPDEKRKGLLVEGGMDDLQVRWIYDRVGSEKA